jgi:hypothetical protein
MKEIHFFCPQCGNEDVYFEPEEGDYTSTNPIIIQQSWRCRYCGYPEKYWYEYYTKTIVHFKITDANGNVIREWNE